MINTKNGEMKIKAAEARGLLEFCHWLLVRHMHVFQAKGGDALLMAQYLMHAGASALEFERLMASNPRQMDRDQRLKLWGAYMKHLQLYLRAGGCFMPKHHLLIHMIKRVITRGNPKMYSTYKDESLNGVIARIARSCNRSCFGLSVHLKYSLLSQCVGSTAYELKARP